MVTSAFKQSGICVLIIFSLCGFSTYLYLKLSQNFTIRQPLSKADNHLDVYLKLSQKMITRQPLSNTGNLNDQYFSSKYLIPSHRLSFFEAVEWCRQKDMQLVELYSDIKNKEVLEYLQSSEHWLWDVDSHVSSNKKTSYWTAGYFFLNDPTWRWWSDGREMRYFNWDLISPHNDTKSEYCMAAYNPWNTDELKWRDDNCSYRKHFICEYPSNVVAKPLVINENCYYISQMKLSIFESKQFCHEQSMRLVNISGEEKQNDILRVLRDSGRVDTVVTLNEFWAIDTDNEPIVVYDNGYALIKDDRPTPYEQNFFICEGIEMEVNQKKSSNYNVENKKYYVSDEMANYEEAFERCISKGMELLSIEDADKNQAVHRELSRRGYRNSIEFWSSGNKLPLDSASWTWGKGSKVRYTHWNYGEPNNSTERENCIQVYNNPDTMGWNDIRCEKRMKYICESSTPRVNLFCIKYVSGHIIDDEINQIIF